MEAKKIEEISILEGDIESAEEILLLKFGITIENKKRKSGCIIGELSGLSGFIKRAKSAGYIVEGNFILKPQGKPKEARRFFCI